LEGAKRARFAPFLCPFAVIHSLLSSNECRSILVGRKDQRYHRRLRCMLRRRYCLRVNVQSGAKRRMPQQLLHHLELSPHASQQGRVGVPKRMPSESLLNSGSLGRGTYVFAQDRLSPVRSSAPIARACKTPVIRLDVGTTLSPLDQSVRE